MPQCEANARLASLGSEGMPLVLRFLLHSGFLQSAKLNFSAELSFSTELLFG